MSRMRLLPKGLVLLPHLARFIVGRRGGSYDNFSLQRMRATQGVRDQARAARATARKVRTKQSAAAAQSSVSGDHIPRGPSNSGGAAVSIEGNCGDVTATNPLFAASADAM